MKKLLLTISLTLLGINLFIGLIFPTYNWFNVPLSSLVLINNAVLLYLSSDKRHSDAYRISLSFIYSFINVVLFIAAQSSPAAVFNNWILMAMIAVSVCQWLLIALIRYMNRHAE